MVDARSQLRHAGLGGRINTVMQTCFFALAGILPRDEAIARIKEAINKTYGKRGRGRAGAEFRGRRRRSRRAAYEVAVPTGSTGKTTWRPAIPESAPDFVKRVTRL